jgi:hypothetical protein
MQPAKIAFSNDDLVELEWVFASVCEALENEQGALTEEDRTCIRRRLFLLACSVMGEPRILRDHLIRSFSSPSKILGARVPLALAEYDAAHRAESGLLPRAHSLSTAK